MTTIALADARPGDLVFCHGSGIISAGIRLCERFRRDYPYGVALTTEAPGDRWNHVAVLSKLHGEPRYPGSWTVMQAEGKGVTDGSDLATVGEFEIVRLPEGCDRALVLDFMARQVAESRKYGYVTIASILLTLFTPRFLNVMTPWTWICSAVAGESLRYASWYHSWPDSYCVSPAQLWMALT